MKFKFYLLAILPLCLAACNKSPLEPGQTGTHTIMASTPESTKYLDGLSVKWSSGQQVWVTKKNGGTSYPFTLVSGENTTVGTFTNEEVVLSGTYYTFSGNYYGKWVGGLFHYRIPQTQVYRENSITSGYIPMLAESSTVTANLEHLASVLHFEVDVDQTLSPLQISSVRLTTLEGTTDLSGRYTLALKTGGKTPVKYADEQYKETVLSGIPSSITAGSKVIFNFVVPACSIDKPTLEITAASGKIYTFTKSSALNAEAGILYKFPAVTIMGEPVIKTPYLICIDGDATKEEDWVKYDSSTSLAATTLIALKPNPNYGENVPITESALSTFITKFKTDVASTVSNPVALDFSRLTYSSTNFASSCFKNVGDRLGNIYLPDNISAISANGLFTGNAKIHLNIGSKIIKIELIQLYSTALIDGAGFFVSVDNTKFSSKEGVLYSKDGKTLYQLPKFKNGASFVVPEGVENFFDYALSNNSILSEVTLPSSIKVICSTNFSYDPYLWCLRFTKVVSKASEVPSLLHNMTQVGTSSGKQRIIVVPDGTIEYYQAALPADFIKGWTIVEESSVFSGGNATIGGLDDNKDYDHGLW